MRLRDIETQPYDETVYLARIPVQQRSREKVDQICDAFRELMHDIDYNDITMRDIADKSNVPVATIYQYFAAKSAILLYIWSGFARGYYDSFLTLAEETLGRNDPQGMLTLMDGMFDHLMQIYRADPAIAAIKDQLEHRAEFREVYAKELAIGSNIVGEFILKSGLVKDRNDAFYDALISVAIGKAALRVLLWVPQDEAEAGLRALKRMFSRAIDSAKREQGM
ncbi:TetR/AcrR family transcriptional regulator [Paracoccaceae bacterium GXU_MW_L88]